MVRNQRRRTADEGHDQQRRQPWLPALLVVVTVCVYFNSLAAGFVFDDREWILENPQVHSIFPLSDVLLNNTRPVIALSYAINYSLGGANPWGYHLVNLIVHCLAGLVLFGIVRRTMLSVRTDRERHLSPPWLAFSIALIWMIHPLQTGAVTYIQQRSESLMGLLYLTTLYCVIRGAGSDRRSWSVLAILSCALGMLTKPIMITAPVVMLLYDRIFLRDSFVAAFRARRWLYAGLGATWLIVLAVLSQPHESDTTMGFDVEGITPLAYATTQPGVILHYLRLALVPYPLCLDYQWPIAQSATAIWPAAMILAAVLIATLWALRRRPAIGFLGAWFFVILAPTSSIVPLNDLAFEHRMYLPLAAVVAGLVLVLRMALRMGLARAVRHPVRLHATRRWMGGGFLIVAAIACGWLTVQRNQDYRSELTIWESNVRHRPTSPRGHNNLASALADAGRYQAALSPYRRALALQPDYAKAHHGYGTALARMGRAEEAIAHYRRALAIDPNLAKAHASLAMSLMHAGAAAEATFHFEEAVRLGPDVAQAHYNLAVALARLDQMQQAIASYRSAVEIDPDYLLAHRGLALSLTSLGRIDEAIRHYNQVLRLNPRDAQVHYFLGNALLLRGQRDQAESHLLAAARLDSTYTRGGAERSGSPEGGQR